VGLGQLSRERLVTGLACTVHRLLHGPIDGVNVLPVVRPPKRAAPRWPEVPGHGERALPLRPRGQATRQKLLDAGAIVLPRRGYHDTRVDDLVEEAGVSHGSFYRYFDRKDDLFHVLAEQAAVRMVQLVGDFPRERGAEPLRAWLERWFAAYRANGGVISAWQEIDYDDPVLASFSREIALVVFDRLVRIVHQRRFGDPSVGALVLLAVIERLPYSVLVLEYLDEPDAVEASLTLIRRGILGLVE
jgi:AcrR family transcriptional regulator